MQNIRIQRFSPAVAGFDGTLEPDDRSWIVFVASDGGAVFYRRQLVELLDGSQKETYADVELPGLVLVDGQGVPPPVAFPEMEHPGPLDFTVVPAHEPMMDAVSPADHARERELHPNARAGFEARLNARSIAAWGATEHEAIRSLLNYVAQLCTAGALDHTGRPMHGHCARRYAAVFGRGA